ncbi:MAG: tail fiber protein [Alphaproteobacteria bacterium]|nr:tail fiber protein [Alphaproteobacteria bacterium]
MSNPFLGQIIMFAGTFSIQDYAFCSGQLMQVSQNPSLFSLLGDNYGGDARTTFGLPDFRGREPVGYGTAPGMPITFWVGQFGGYETITLGTVHLPTHAHDLSGSSGSPATGTLEVATDIGNQTAPATDTHISQATSGVQNFFKSPFGSPTLTTIPGLTVSGGGMTVPTITDAAGGGQSFPIRDPYLVITYQIALDGTYPSRN